MIFRELAIANCLFSILHFEVRNVGYNQTWKLHNKGWSTSKIAQKVGVSTRTVQRYLHMPTFPERQTRSDCGKSLLNPYKEYVLQLWNSGEHKPKNIFRKLQKKKATTVVT